MTKYLLLALLSITYQLVAMEQNTHAFITALQNNPPDFEDGQHNPYYQTTNQETFEYVYALDPHNPPPQDLLHHIVQRPPDTGTYQFVEFLLEHGFASATARDSMGRTPMHYVHYWSRSNQQECCCAGTHAKHQQFIELLTRYGGDVNARDHEGNTPLHLLCDRLTCPQVIQALIVCGADPFRCNDAGQDPIVYRQVMDGYHGASACLHVVTQAQIQHARCQHQLHLCGQATRAAIVAALIYNMLSTFYKPV